MLRELKKRNRQTNAEKQMKERTKGDERRKEKALKSGRKTTQREIIWKQRMKEKRIQIQQSKIESDEKLTKAEEPL